MAVYRRDVNTFAILTCGELSELLAIVADRLGTDAYLVPNNLGNLSILTPEGREPDGSPSPNGIGGWYIGYVDFATGEVVWDRDPEQAPFDEVHSVDGVTPVASRPASEALR